MSSYDVDEEATALLNPLYALGLFVAAGIYLVFKRYQNIRYRAVPFFIKPPAVGILASLHSVQGSQHSRPLPPHGRRLPSQTRRLNLMS
jgi:hypothetical protein